MRAFCIEALASLAKADPKDWAALFIRLRMEFHRLYSKGRVCSTSHGVDFFENVLDFAAGVPWEEPGEYGNNFRSIVRENL